MNLLDYKWLVKNTVEAVSSLMGDKFELSVKEISKDCDPRDLNIIQKDIIYGKRLVGVQHFLNNVNHPVESVIYINTGLDEVRAEIALSLIVEEVEGILEKLSLDTIIKNILITHLIAELSVAEYLTLYEEPGLLSDSVASKINKSEFKNFQLGYVASKRSLIKELADRL